MAPVIAAAVAGLLAGVGAATAVYTRRRRRRARQLYQEHLERALADGILTAEEVQELEALRAAKDVSGAEARMVAIAIYRRALRDVGADARVTVEEDERLRQLQQQLGLTDADLSADRQQMQRLRLLAAVERGRLPEVAPPFPLEKEELGRWVVHATLCEPLALRRAARVEPAHLSFAVVSEEPFHADGPREPFGRDPDILPVDLGMLVVTSRRSIFRGAKRRFDLPHARLGRLDLFRDGLRLHGTDAARFLLLEDAELTGAVLLTAARQRRAELSGLPARSA